MSYNNHFEDKKESFVKIKKQLKKSNTLIIYTLIHIFNKLN